MGRWGQTKPFDLASGQTKRYRNGSLEYNFQMVSPAKFIICGLMMDTNLPYPRSGSDQESEEADLITDYQTNGHRT